MGEFKGTPGPWLVKTHRLFSGKSLIGSVTDANGNSIRVSAFALSSGDEAEANTHLCAAALDLLETARTWLDYAETTLHEFDTDEECGDALCPRCEAAGCIKMKIETTRAAIAKALGDNE